MYVIIVFRNKLVTSWPPVIVVMIPNGLSLLTAVAIVNISRVIYLHVLFLIWLQRQLAIRWFLFSLFGSSFSISGLGVCVEF